MFITLLLVVCPTLTAPDNGVIVCSLGDDGAPTNEDTCTVTCNDGFDLSGAATRRCRVRRNKGTWTGQKASCTGGIQLMMSHEVPVFIIPPHILIRMA